uniref:autoinducer binding domain-containing protein n=1 Tax=Sphingomonas bacterium TaxID=1895847 RepID=UPI0026282539|nr:autoinducer binding domain-containing protein [Sphingomonas bacterium]
MNFGLERAPAIRLHNYPAAWQRWFDENQLGRSDSVHRASQLICGGFPWSIVSDVIQLTSIDRSVFAQARVIGIGDGYTIPGEFTGSCSFAMAPGEPFTRELQAVAQIIGGIAFQAARRITRIREAWPPIERPLTERQRDCVLWSTRGKTDWETGGILGISKGNRVFARRRVRFGRSAMSKWRATRGHRRPSADLNDGFEVRMALFQAHSFHCPRRDRRRAGPNGKRSLVWLEHYVRANDSAALVGVCAQRRDPKPGESVIAAAPRAFGQYG